MQLMLGLTFYAISFATTLENNQIGVLYVDYNTLLWTYEAQIMDAQASIKKQYENGKISEQEYNRLRQINLQHKADEIKQMLNGEINEQRGQIKTPEDIARELSLPENHTKTPEMMVSAITHWEEMRNLGLLAVADVMMNIASLFKAFENSNSFCTELSDKSKFGGFLSRIFDNRSCNTTKIFDPESYIMTFHTVLKQLADSDSEQIEEYLRKTIAIARKDWELNIRSGILAPADHIKLLTEFYNLIQLTSFNLTGDIRPYCNYFRTH